MASSMRYVAAYLLAVLGGQQSPKAADIEKILSSVGIETDKAKLAIVLKELNGKNVQELIAEGSKKLASVPTGPAQVASAAGDAAKPATAEEPKAEQKKEEKVESEESDDDMGFGLFD